MADFEAARIALSRSRVIIRPDRFVVAAAEADSDPVLETEENKLFSVSSHFLVFRDEREITYVFPESSLDEFCDQNVAMRLDRGWKLLTFSQELEMTLVGFIALVGRIMAESGVPILALSSFSRDHLLIKEDRLESAVTALAPHVAGIDR